MSLTRTDSKLVNFATQARFDNSSKPATTAFVRQNGVQFNGYIWINSSITLTSSHMGGIVVCSGANIVVTLPPVNSIPVGTVVAIKNNGGSTVSIRRQGADSIGAYNTTYTDLNLRIGDSVILINEGSTVWWAWSGGLDYTQAVIEKAPLASPAFTGTPTAPTPVSSDNSTKLATTAFVKNNYVDWWPYINPKANIDSPALTGTPTAPTPASSDNSTRIATTAFVKNNYVDWWPYITPKANNDSPTLTGTPNSTTPPLWDYSTRIATTAFVKDVVAANAVNVPSYFADANFGTNGYQKIPGGLIFQWCRASIPGGGGTRSVTAYFPIAFPNACISAMSTPMGSTSGGGDQDYWSVNNLAYNSLTVTTMYDGAQTALIFAVGY